MGTIYDNLASEDVDNPNSGLDQNMFTWELSDDGTGYICTGLNADAFLVNNDFEIRNYGALVIPDEYDGLPVIGIGKDAFREENYRYAENGEKNLLHDIFDGNVIIPYGVEVVGYRAFEGYRINECDCSAERVKDKRVCVRGLQGVEVGNRSFERKKC